MSIKKIEHRQFRDHFPNACGASLTLLRPQPDLYLSKR
jgi:hypothetical protein